MYSNRTDTYIHVNETTNGQVLMPPSSLKQLEHILLTLYDVRMENSLYNITETNNRLVMTHATAGTLDLTIPVGYYTVLELRDQLNELLALNATVVYDIKTFKYTFVSTKLITIEDGTTCRRVLGTGDTFPLTATLYPAYSLVLPKKINMNTSDFITVKIKELNTAFIQPFINRDNTFCKIPVNAPHGQAIFYRQEVPISYLLRKTNIRTLTITLYNDFGDLLDIDFSLQFKMSYVYLPPDQEIVEEKEDDNNDLFKFTHVDGPVKKIIGNSGGFNF